MSLHRIIAFAISFVLLAGVQGLGQELKKPAEPGDFQQLYRQWQSLLGDMAEVQAKFSAASSSQHEALRSQLDELIKQAGQLSSKLQAAAEQAYAADDQNKEVGDLLFVMALDHLRSDNYEEALRLSRLLIEHEYPENAVYRIAASAAFPTMHLDDAKKYVEAAAGEQEPTDPSFKRLLAEIEKYQPLWEEEQKLREAEAKADDLLPRVKLHTNKGDIVVELFENEAPNTVANFISLVKKGFYDGTQLHRVLPSFMAQGGDPLSKDPQKNAGAIGTGGPGYAIACECTAPNHRKHFRGTLSMAHSGPNTGGSQFFLTFAPTGQLDGMHTVFGRIIDGMDVLSKLQRVDPERPTGVTPDTIVKAEVLRKRDHPYEPEKLGETMNDQR